jgi:hypothetical protein
MVKKEAPTTAKKAPPTAKKAAAVAKKAAAVAKKAAAVAKKFELQMQHDTAAEVKYVTSFANSWMPLNKKSFALR